MTESGNKIYAPCQSWFHERWDHLQDRHVRALAWLLDDSDLLDQSAPQWLHKIARLSVDLELILKWLTLLDQAPTPLHDFLHLQKLNRLGRYAEKLMAYYFQWCGVLVAHGLQVQDANHSTIGEFDFLVNSHQGLLHYEFATKFYLFEAPSGSAVAKDLVGPNLADTLDAKMNKILNRQLALSQNPAAQVYLPAPVFEAEALIKGWLFYPAIVDDGLIDPQKAKLVSGVAAQHCRGFWCAFSTFERLIAQDYFEENSFLILTRLAWLAPAKTGVDAVMGATAACQSLQAHFSNDSMPVMLACMKRDDKDTAREIARGFIVPDDWRQRAYERSQRTVLQPT
jgi:hypothetical protein